MSDYSTNLGSRLILTVMGGSHLAFLPSDAHVQTGTIICMLQSCKDYARRWLEMLGRVLVRTAEMAGANVTGLSADSLGEMMTGDGCKVSLPQVLSFGQISCILSHS